MKLNREKIIISIFFVGLAFGLYISERLLNGEIAPGGELLITLTPIIIYYTPRMFMTVVDLFTEVKEELK